MSVPSLGSVKVDIVLNLGELAYVVILTLLSLLFWSGESFMGSWARVRRGLARCVNE